MTSGNSFIAELIQKKEDSQIEFLSDFRVHEILQVICSFLNSDGGWLLIGYDGKNFSGLTENRLGIADELKLRINDQIFPQPMVDVRTELYMNYRCVLINVIKGARQPYSYQKKYYIRIGSQTLEATPDAVSLLLRKSNEYASTWEKQTASDATLDDLNQEEIQSTISQAIRLGRGKSLPDDPAGFLNYFQLLDMSQVRNGSVVLFGKEPVKFIPQCLIRITVMPHGKTGSHFDDILLIYDNLFSTFYRLQDYFKRNLPLISEFSHNNWDRITRGKYPMDALDEAILNAMVHRDYADISGEITINIFQDKMEIINSGEIPDAIISEKNTIKEHHSILRNPAIAHIFYLRGKIEKIGRGLTLIKNRFEEYGLKLPEWTIRGGYTTLTLYGTPKPVRINNRMITFLRSLKTGEQFSRQVFEQFFNKRISEKTARNDIAIMTEGGWVEKVGEGPSTRYARTSKELPEITG